MKVELIAKTDALKRYEELKEMAFSIAKAHNSLPAYCDAPECKLFTIYAALAVELQEGEVCIFINNEPAEHLTDLEISPGKFLVAKICSRNIAKVQIDNDILTIQYHDGVIEKYSFFHDLQVWKFESKNVSVNVPSTSAN